MKTFKGSSIVDDERCDSRGCVLHHDHHESHRDSDGMAIWGESKTVDHPPHYNANPSGVECITVVEHMNFNIGNAIKYLWRAGFKGAIIEDLKKASWYVDREIQRLAKEKNEF